MFVPVRLKYLIVSFVFLLSQSIGLGLATAHDIDPGHAGEDCGVCLTVQGKDDTPPAAPRIFEKLPHLSVCVEPVRADDKCVAVHPTSQHARAPPA